MQYFSCLAGRAVLCAALALGAAGPVFAQPVIPGTSALSLQESFASVADYYKARVVSVTAERVVRSAAPQYEFYFGDPFDQFFEDYYDGGQPRSRSDRQAPRPRYHEKKLEGGGTGVIINDKGYVLTNYHVVSGADDIRVRVGTDESQTYGAEVVGTDAYTDLAVLKIKANRKFQAAEIGDSDALKVGDWVIAIGSPFGLEQTVTAGIVSAKRQSMAIEGNRYENLIQTDAAINRGNSGGPLVNIRGELIGINTAIFAPTGVFSGVGFAIPISEAKRILNDLIEKGKVVRGWLGVEIKDVDDAIARQFGLEEKQGALINKVLENSPAEKSGLRRGDIIVIINGEKIKDTAHLQKIVKSSDPGQKASMLVMRDGAKKTVNVTLQTMPDDAAAMPSRGEPGGVKKTAYVWKGITVETLDAQTRQEHRIPDETAGVVVTGIERGSDDMGLREGDVIKGVNRTPVASADSFKKAVARVSLSDGVVFDIIRGGVAIYISYQSH